MRQMILALALMLTAGAAAQTQNTDDQQAKRQQMQAQMVQKRTEAMAKKYGLNEEQTAKLLELNQTIMPMRHNGGAFAGQRMQRQKDMQARGPRAARQTMGCAGDSCCRADSLCPMAKERKAGAQRGAQRGDGKRFAMNRGKLRGGNMAAAGDSIQRQRRGQFGGQAQRMADYDKQLQEIMTKEQYEAYKADMQKRMQKFGGKAAKAKQ